MIWIIVAMYIMAGVAVGAAIGIWVCVDTVTFPEKSEDDRRLVSMFIGIALAVAWPLWFLICIMSLIYVIFTN